MANTNLTPNTGSLSITGQKPTVKTITEFWVRNPIYLSIALGAAVGSLIFGFIPGWGSVINVVCTLLSLVAGFKAGMKYRVEISR